MLRRCMTVSPLTVLLLICHVRLAQPFVALGIRSLPSATPTLPYPAPSHRIQSPRTQRAAHATQQDPTDVSQNRSNPLLKTLGDDVNATKATAVALLVPILSTVSSARAVGSLLWRIRRDIDRDRQRPSTAGNGRPKGISWWSDRPAFQRLSSWAFEQCAACTASPEENSARTIDRTQVYAGILLVHLHLAQYLGVAACHPPSRDTVDSLVDRADCARPGLVTQQEFTNVLVLSCAHISGRIAVYSILLLGLPLAGAKIAMWTAPLRQRLGSVLLGPTGTAGQNMVLYSALESASWLFQHIVSLTVFVTAVPILVNWIDRQAQRLVKLNPKKPRRWWMLSE